jgi:NAD-dependent dihydropyrimidine dehydrogenase PreA subunit
VSRKNFNCNRSGVVIKGDKIKNVFINHRDLTFSRRGIFTMVFIPTINREKCKGCEECLEACSADVFEMQQGKSVPVKPEECLGCQSCVEVCEENAISVEETGQVLTEQCSR